jgi:hypothetical protein
LSEESSELFCFSFVANEGEQLQLTALGMLCLCAGREANNRKYFAFHRLSMSLNLGRRRRHHRGV